MRIEMWQGPRGTRYLVLDCLVVVGDYATMTEAVLRAEMGR